MTDPHHTQPVTPGAASDHEERIARLETRVHLAELSLCALGARLAEIPAYDEEPAPAPTNDERAAWVDHVMNLAHALPRALPGAEYYRASGKLRDAITDIVRGLDPRSPR